MPRQPASKAPRKFVKTEIAAEILEISVPALEADRVSGQLGIPYHKFASRVRYDLDTLYAWADDRRCTPPGRAEHDRPELPHQAELHRGDRPARRSQT
jgi:hypothetical protein